MLLKCGCKYSHLFNFLFILLELYFKCQKKKIGGSRTPEPPILNFAPPQINSWIRPWVLTSLFQRSTNEAIATGALTSLVLLTFLNKIKTIIFGPRFLQCRKPYTDRVNITNFETE